MPDSRNHRGPSSEDAKLFAEPRWPVLQRAVRDLSWLLSCGYNSDSALKLVGDHYQLTERQRTAVRRSACSDEQLRHRLAALSARDDCCNASLEIDGFNIITTIESALSGAALLLGRDGCIRDLASLHGTYRKVAETLPAIGLAGEAISSLKPRTVRWLLDRPVSNSGRLRALLLEKSSEQGWNWEVVLSDRTDAALSSSPGTIITADSQILDRCQRWYNLTAQVIGERITEAKLVPLCPTNPVG